MEDCREILPTLDKVDLVLTDPPYGIGKAKWDNDFPIWWLDEAARLSPLIGVMCGTWNLLKLPQIIGDNIYKWTLAAHLVNGMTRGGFGFGNWIPCVVYKRPIRRDMPEDVQNWCRTFAGWCQANGVSKKNLDTICGTSDMGGWWLGLLPHRCTVPAPHQWLKIKTAIKPPEELDILGAPHESDYLPKGDCKDFVIGTTDKPNHPSPKPVNVISWFLDCLGGDLILDPFLGSGTTAYCAKKLNRKCIGIEIEEKYCEIAAKRCSQSVMRLEV